jgi:hypothetical protein
MADASFFSGIVEGSGFAVGEAVFVVILVAVAVGFGMTKDSLLEYLGTKIHGFFRTKKAASAIPQAEWHLPSWARIAVWLLVTGLSGFLAWKAIPTAIERKADQLPISSAGLPAGAIWNNEGNFEVVVASQNGPAAPTIRPIPPTVDISGDLTILNNEEVREAAYVLATKIDGHVNGCIEKFSDIDRNKSISDAEKGTLKLQFDAACSKDFRTKFSSDVLKVQVDLQRRLKLQKDPSTIAFASGILGIHDMDMAAFKLRNLAKLLP